MNKGILILLVVLLFIGGLGMIMYAMFSSVSILPKLSNTTRNIDDYRSVAEINRAYFHTGINDTIDCADAYNDAIVQLRFSNELPSGLCQLRVDTHLVEIIELSDICTASCMGIEHSMSIGRLLLNDSHRIQLCCSSVCNEKELEAYC